MSHREAVELYKKADIVIDQILCGAYGNLSVEAMALGKPVICFIRPDLLQSFPSTLPVQSANPDTLYAVLRDLVLDGTKRAELGKQGRLYVEEHHDAAKVAQQLKAIYKSLIH